MSFYFSYKSFPELAGLPSSEAEILYKEVRRLANGSREGSNGMLVMMCCMAAGGAFGNAVGGVFFTAMGVLAGCMLGSIYFGIVVQKTIRSLLRERGYPRS